MWMGEVGVSIKVLPRFKEFIHRSESFCNDNAVSIVGWIEWIWSLDPSSHYGFSTHYVFSNRIIDQFKFSRVTFKHRFDYNAIGKTQVMDVPAYSFRANFLINGIKVLQGTFYLFQAIVKVHKVGDVKGLHHCQWGQPEGLIGSFQD